MKTSISNRGDRSDHANRFKNPTSNIRKTKNLQRLGGGGLSLEAFANAKTKSLNYNPSEIKQCLDRGFQAYDCLPLEINPSLSPPYNSYLYAFSLTGFLCLRESEKKKEFYKNAKYLQKFKKQVKQGNQQDDENEPGGTKKMTKENKKVKKGSHSLEAVYAKRHEEVEKERLEREAVINARKEERDKAEARRKDLKGKMLKKTKKGQPVMKYRIEHLLETLQRSAT
ncbi:hypothetical protein V2J09_016135 [Rumex salicifolius]